MKILNDKENKDLKSILIFDKTVFYPLGGGQLDDTGKIVIDGREFNIVRVAKVGPCVLHYTDCEISGLEEEKTYTVRMQIDEKRRVQLMQHHTGAHILAAACR